MSSSPDKPVPSRVLGARALAAITAVEGLELSPSSRGRLRRMAAEGLSPDEQRATILRNWQKTRTR